jgi:LuxR family transcriptional regulator, maltose regulon positive regulatory protein
MDTIRVEPSTTLVTRVRPPHLRRDVVSRPRLLDLLDSGVRREVTLVSAPAGFGKTTLLAEWAATSTRPVAWLALAEADADPSVLRAEIVAALGRVARSERVVLVLDGYEEIAGSAADAALSELLHVSPAGLQIVVSGRVDPPFPLGDALEIRASDLRMTELEAAELLHRALGESLAVREVLRRIDGCDGVPGALRLAADEEAGAPAAALTERELAVLRLLADGLSTREIGLELDISFDAVLGHTKAIFRKLGVSSRVEAVARAHEFGVG